MTEKELIRRAAEALPRSYAPYSNFPVAAAIETASGKVFVGVNVENGAYPLGMCAEASAVAGAVTAGERKFVRIAIVTPTARPTPPCGACRQILAEFARDMIVLMAAKDLRPVRTRLSRLLPRRFGGPSTT